MTRKNMIFLKICVDKRGICGYNNRALFIAVLFSTLIGLLFGFGPANKAVKIPALDAIKNNE